MGHVDQQKLTTFFLNDIFCFIFICEHECVHFAKIPVWLSFPIMYMKLCCILSSKKEVNSN
jgi:hypothetical protein